jgi:NAD(P)-dependent dehydrogenase (short-subunit alcohol dehydrogenase family)
MRFLNEVALVAGAGRGIRSQIARRLAAEGAGPRFADESEKA